jgi:hypothetical protein
MTDQTADPLHNRIARAIAQVAAWLPDEIEGHYGRGMSAGDMMEPLLRNLARGFFRPDPGFVLGTLTSIVILRAQEIVDNTIMECDEDHCWVQTEAYRRRRELMIEALQDVVAHGPYAVAELSGPGLSGLPLSDAHAGARLPVVREAWNHLRGAMAPYAYTAAVQGSYRR